ncbi:hypothetical protein DPEC_G00179320 [Dallia pectoralis]|uniref:Uncharacterized protein n=1 Tax=Dallia pectoralis TaxID=75939 RepID=A0ACC2GFP3_DALPE|nr:hypothetical protein DPEC_G00179320 [Dallia pectoralis]
MDVSEPEVHLGASSAPDPHNGYRLCCHNKISNSNMPFHLSSKDWKRQRLVCLPLRSSPVPNEPPTTAQRRLGELRQSKETVSEFAKEVHRLVILAYPGIDTELREQIAADAFLKRLRNQKVA